MLAKYFNLSKFGIEKEEEAMSEEIGRIFYRVHFKYKGDSTRKDQVSSQHTDEKDAVELCRQNSTVVNGTTEDWHVVRVTEYTQRIWPEVKL